VLLSNCASVFRGEVSQLIHVVCLLKDFQHCVSARIMFFFSASVVKAGSAKGLVLTHPLSLSLTLAISPTCFLLHCRPYLTCRDSPVRQMDELSKTPSSLSASFTLSVYLSGKQMPIKARQSNRVAPYTHATNKDSTRCAKTSRD